ncbi:Hypothetical_protein [Hexamita inflata]|uniref:Hypothetical_protein n=1 Tax=Hexamita inflata TaxID=28002 RepID=A0AA86R540_9EUKA|nr:Hypothetical protein HINF_LOCUS50080 [Hexamita inflata]
MISLFVHIQASSPTEHCELQFESVNSSCICNLKMSSNKKFCAPNCSDFDEIELNEICVPKITRKSTDADGCATGSLQTHDCVCDSITGWEQVVGISDFQCTSCYSGGMIPDGIVEQLFQQVCGRRLIELRGLFYVINFVETKQCQACQYFHFAPNKNNANNE